MLGSRCGAVSGAKIHGAACSEGRRAATEGSSRHSPGSQAQAPGPTLLCQVPLCFSCLSLSPSSPFKQAHGKWDGAFQFSPTVFAFPVPGPACPFPSSHLCPLPHLEGGSSLLPTKDQL